jgi:hypothetical protein
VQSHRWKQDLWHRTPAIIRRPSSRSRGCLHDVSSSTCFVLSSLTVSMSWLLLVARFLAYRLSDALGPAPSDSPYIELSTATNTSLLGHCTHVSRIASSSKLGTALESRLRLLTSTTFYPVRRRSISAFFSTSSLSLLHLRSPTVRSYLGCVFPRLRELATDLIS